MSNPLDPLRDALSVAYDSMMITSACVGRGAGWATAGTQFDPPNITSMQAELDKARLELDDLFVLAMTASFEVSIKDYIKTQVAVAPGPYQAALQDWLDDQVESAKLYRLGGIFKPPITASLLKTVDEIRAYRNWVAHGRSATKTPPTMVTPPLAYSTLTTFLKSTGMI